jgi:hypothetical protein
LIVNAAKAPSVPRPRRDRIRAAIHALRRAPKYEIDDAIASLRGKIGYVAQFNRGSAERLVTYLNLTHVEQEIGCTPPTVSQKLIY